MVMGGNIFKFLIKIIRVVTQVMDMRLTNFVIKDKILQLGKGDFQIFIDDTHNEHKISDHILELVYKDIS